MSIAQDFDSARKEIDKLLKDAEELVGKYTDIIGSHIPATLKQAIEEKWEMTVKHLELDLLTQYPKEKQKHDNQLLIRWSDAEELCREFEQKLSDAIFLGPIGIVVQVWIHTVRFSVVLVEIIATVLDTVLVLVQKWGWRAVFTHIWDIIYTTGLFIVVFFLVIVKASFTTGALSRFSQGIVPMLKARDAQCQRLREKALPQAARIRVGVRRQSRALTKAERKKLHQQPPPGVFIPPKSGNLPPANIPPPEPVPGPI
jgi:hypothetical protein